MFLYLFTIHPLFLQVKMLMFYSVQITNSAVVGKNEMHSRQLWRYVIPNSMSH